MICLHLRDLSCCQGIFVLRGQIKAAEGSLQEKVGLSQSDDTTEANGLAQLHGMLQQLEGRLEVMAQ